MFGSERIRDTKIPIPEPVSVILRAVWGRLTVKLILTGIVFVLAGYNAGSSIWAGILPLWGTGLIILGTVFHIVIWRIRRPSHDGGEYR